MRSTYTLCFYAWYFEPWKADLRIDKDLVAASATPLVLAILADGESYGYAILKRVRALSGGELEWTDGMLYPLLHRLRRLGYVTTEWRSPPEGRRRQYYMLTDDGRAALADQQRQWVAVTRALNNRAGPVEAVIGPGCFNLHQTFALSAAQSKSLCHKGAAAADFDPNPRLDPKWDEPLKAFRAVPKTDFGFRVVLWVVEEPAPPAESGKAP